MPRYKTLGAGDAEKAIEQVAGLEPLVIDGKLMAVIVRPLRIYAQKDGLIVSEREDTSDAN